MEKNWVLTDTLTQTNVDELLIRPDDVGGSAKGYMISKRTLRGGLSEGVDEIRVDNGTFSFAVLPTRGMGIWKAWLGKEEVGWKSPVHGPVHPKFVQLTEPSGLGWLDGFDELLVRCGLESNGAPEFDDKNRLTLPLHGRIANKPAHSVQVSVDGANGEITVRGVVDETRFHFAKLRLSTLIQTKVGETGFRIHDEIENLSGTPVEVQMLYHTNFGPPFLDAGARVVAPAKTIVPRNPRAAEGMSNWDSYRAEEAGFAEQVYFLELFGDEKGQTRVLLKNAHGTRGASLYYNVQQLPCFSVWKNTEATADGYLTGIEPGTNYPNPKSFESKHGRVIKLAPGAKAPLDLRVEIHADSAAVDAAEKAVAALQKGKPKIYDQPQPTWCAP